jgi:hypothetical protein
MQLHKDAHPARVSGFFGVTAQWTRRLWNRFTPEEIRSVSDEEALGILARIRHGETQSSNTERTPVKVIRAARQAIPDRGCESCPECAVAGISTRLASRKV